MADRLSILMMSTHGYVSADPQLGMPDTGGQVVFVLELARHLNEQGHRVDIVTRRFEDQPEYDEIADGLRVWRIPFGGTEFIRKKRMHEHLPELSQNLALLGCRLGGPDGVPGDGHPARAHPALPGRLEARRDGG